jgi:hypothetical protein
MCFDSGFLLPPRTFQPPKGGVPTLQKLENIYQ